jgi:hypothetical protein
MRARGAAGAQHPVLKSPHLHTLFSKVRICAWCCRHAAQRPILESQYTVILYGSHHILTLRIQARNNCSVLDLALANFAQYPMLKSQYMCVLYV